MWGQPPQAGPVGCDLPQVRAIEYTLHPTSTALRNLIISPSSAVCTAREYDQLLSLSIRSTQRAAIGILYTPGAVR
jgi:hypothetical protein